MLNVGHFSADYAIAQILVLFFGIGLHEYAHCKFADMAGDPTPSYYGRVTLNLSKHFTPMGSLMILLSTFSGFGIGWGKPAPIDPRKMKNPRLDTFIAVAAGPLSNILQALLYALALRILLSRGGVLDDPYHGNPDFAIRFCTLGIITNLALALFNLIPFGPLDGHWLVGELLPDRLRFQWYRLNRQYIGFPGLMIAVFAMDYLGVSPISAPLTAAVRFLVGI